MTQRRNYQLIVKEGIPLIKEWINKHKDNPTITETTHFKELVRIIP